MGELSEEASQVSAGFRVILGGAGLTLAIVALSSRNFSPAEAQSLLYALGTGFCLIVAIFASVKLRGYGVFPVPPCNNVFNTRCNSLLYSFRIDC